MNKKSKGVKRKKKVSKAYIAKRPRAWQKRWVTKEVLGGFKVKVMAWVTSKFACSPSQLHETLKFLFCFYFQPPNPQCPVLRRPR